MRVITKVNAQVASKYSIQRPSCSSLSEGNTPDTLFSRMGSWSVGGVLAITRNEGPDRNWKDLPYPGKKLPEKDLFHNQNGKGTGDMAEVGWAHSSDEGKETSQSQGALLQGVLQSKQRREV